MNWKKIVREIAATGLTQTQIGEICGMSQAAVSAMLIGVRSNPSFAVGRALLDLHDKQTRKSKKQREAA